MKISCLLSVLLFSTVVSYSQCADPSNTRIFNYDGKSYMVVMEEKTWTEAATCAQELGGYLVEIGSSEEQEAVLSGILDSAGVASDYVSIFNGGGIAYVWIGATDQAEEGTWLWDGDGDGDGEHFWSGQGTNGDGDGSIANNSWVNWGGSSTGIQKEPDNYGGGGQDHAAIGLAGWPDGSGALGIQGEWNDIAGNSAIYFVVEFEGIVGRKEHLQTKGGLLRLFPNPSGDMVYIETEDFKQVEILDMCGTLHGLHFQREFSVSDLSPGIYLCRISTLSGTSTLKLRVK